VEAADRLISRERVFDGHAHVANDGGGEDVTLKALATDVHDRFFAEDVSKWSSASLKPYARARSVKPPHAGRNSHPPFRGHPMSDPGVKHRTAASLTSASKKKGPAHRARLKPITEAGYSDLRTGAPRRAWKKRCAPP
jgi:hypothetical protein